MVEPNPRESTLLLVSQETVDVLLISLSLLSQEFYMESKLNFIEKIRKPKLKNTSLIDELKLNVHLFKITRKLHGFAF